MRLRRLAEYLLVALILGLPFEYYFADRPESLRTSLKLQLGLLLIAWLASRVRGAATFLRDVARAVPRRFLVALGLFVVVQAAAAGLAREERGNAARAAAKTLAGALVLAAAADLTRGASAGPDRLATRLLGALAATGVATSVIGFGELAGIGRFDDLVGLFQYERFFVGTHRRFISTMEYPNTAAGFLAAALFAALALAGRRKDRAAWLWAPAIGVLALALILTYSRGAVGAAILALGAASWLSLRKPAESRFRLFTGAALLGLAAGLVLIVPRPAPPQPVSGPMRPRQAGFGLPDGRSSVRTLRAGSALRESIGVRNDSMQLWRRGGFGIGYRWYNLETRTTSPLQHAATFEADVAPGQERIVPVVCETPPAEGEYLLIWFVFHRDPAMTEIADSFSPAVLCIVRATEGAPPPLSEEARRFKTGIDRERRQVAAKARPSRRELWRAALRMALDRPLAGVGPDNFRLLKWRYMDVPAGDDTILANNLYLETAAGAGFPGLAALLLLLVETGRLLARLVAQASSPADRAFASFAVAFFAAVVLHGLVDYLLKFTPIFLLFWIFLGMLCAYRPPTAEANG